MPNLHQVLVSPLVGGAAILAMRLAAAATRRQLPCVAWVPGEGPASRELTREGVPWRTYDLEAMRGSILPHLLASARMMPALFEWERPVVHVHNPVVYRFLRPALIGSRARTVVHFHIEPADDEILWSLAYPPDHVVACAAYIAERVRHVLEREQRVVPRISAVPNSVDLARFTPGSQEAARSLVGIPTTNFVVLMMANLAPHKGQETAIHAVRLLNQRGLRIDCWLAGQDREESGAYERKLRQMIDDLGLGSQVRLLGFRADGPELLRAADMLLLPSTHEGLPLTILEAQASGTPVLASTIPGVLEIIEHGRTGFTIPADDVEGYASTIARLYDNKELRASVTAAALENVSRNFSWAALEERMFAIYQLLLQQGNGNSQTRR